MQARGRRGDCARSARIERYDSARDRRFRLADDVGRQRHLAMRREKSRHIARELRWIEIAPSSEQCARVLPPWAAHRGTGFQPLLARRWHPSGIRGQRPLRRISTRPPSSLRPKDPARNFTRVSLKNQELGGLDKEENRELQRSRPDPSAQYSASPARRRRGGSCGNAFLGKGERKSCGALSQSFYKSGNSPQLSIYCAAGQPGWRKLVSARDSKFGGGDTCGSIPSGHQHLILCGRHLNFCATGLTRRAQGNARGIYAFSYVENCGWSNTRTPCMFWVRARVTRHKVCCAAAPSKPQLGGLDGAGRFNGKGETCSPRRRRANR